jgi:ABC transporter substrate binding protein (PQQ-dependent alcohol dehydrogenase system)
MEYLLVKQWRTVFLAVGPTDGDRNYAAAVKQSIAKFRNVHLVAEKPWTFQPGSRRSDTGHFTVSAEVASFTQGLTYDVLIVADEEDDFGDYLSYATTLPRPVVGTQGMIVGAWARPHQEWGATQLQDRFLHQSKRGRRSGDAGAIGRPADLAGPYAQRQVPACRLQRPGAELSPVGRTDAPGYPPL